MRWIETMLVACTLACGGSGDDAGSESGEGESGPTTSGDTGTGTGSGTGTGTTDGDGECPADIAAGQPCGGTQCCDPDDHMWRCECVGQCEDNCCTWEPAVGGYCIVSNGQYLCGLGNDMGEACPMDIQEGTECDTLVLEACCAADGSIYRCSCMEACIWERQDCSVSDECL